MAKGFSAGLVHGGLICGAGLVALSLALPQPQRPALVPIDEGARTQPAPETAITEQPIAEKPLAEMPVPESPIPESPTSETPAPETPVVATPATDTPAASPPAEMPVGAAGPAPAPAPADPAPGDAGPLASTASDENAPGLDSAAISATPQPDQSLDQPLVEAPATAAGPGPSAAALDLPVGSEFARGADPAPQIPTPMATVEPPLAAAPLAVAPEAEGAPIPDDSVAARGDAPAAAQAPQLAALPPGDDAGLAPPAAEAAPLAEAAPVQAAMPALEPAPAVPTGGAPQRPQQAAPAGAAKDPDLSVPPDFGALRLTSPNE